MRGRWEAALEAKPPDSDVAAGLESLLGRLRGRDAALIAEQGEFQFGDALASLEIYSNSAIRAAATAAPSVSTGA